MKRFMLFTGLFAAMYALGMNDPYTIQPAFAIVVPCVFLATAGILARKRLFTA